MTTNPERYSYTIFTTDTSRMRDRSDMRKKETALGSRPDQLLWANAADGSSSEGREARKRLIKYQTKFCAIYPNNDPESHTRRYLRGGAYYNWGSNISQMIPSRTKAN